MADAKDSKKRRPRKRYDKALPPAMHELHGPWVNPAFEIIRQVYQGPADAVPWQELEELRSRAKIRRIRTAVRTGDGGEFEWRDRDKGGPWHDRHPIEVDKNRAEQALDAAASAVSVEMNRRRRHKETMSAKKAAREKEILDALAEYTGDRRDAAAAVAKRLGYSKAHVRKVRSKERKKCVPNRSG